MPFTSFHFGPGLLAKALAPTRFSFTTFAVTQVVIDVESLYHLLKQDWPVHRQLHSLLGASLTGLLVAGLVVAGRPLVKQMGSWSVVSADTTTLAAVVGGLLGGVTHSLLDAMFHSDVSPMWPLAASNRLFGVISPEAVEVGCLLASVVGLSGLWLRRRKRRLVV